MICFSAVQAVLEEALKQLYVLDAIDANGKITGLGRRLALLPLEPSLGRALVAAQELG
jgi:ATP-dependent RNA helicase DHX8/PRP22